jgi:hypothetical protein
MLNVNEVKVEQRIAQERFQVMVEARNADRIVTGDQPHVSVHTQVLDWLGRQAGKWGVSWEAARDRVGERAA